MSPKSLLRHPMVQSTFEEIELDTRFKALIPDEVAKPESVEKIIICAGKVYYDLITERKARNLQNQIAILRIEQFCPFPYYLLSQQIANYPKSKVILTPNFYL
jgi:2-oxoglutarate dehydrogenase E1 component